VSLPGGRTPQARQQRFGARPAKGRHRSQELALRGQRRSRRLDREPPIDRRHRQAPRARSRSVPTRPLPRPAPLAQGDFQESNVVVTDDDKAFLIDFECVGIGNRDHDFAWFWLHTSRHPDWKRRLLNRWLGSAVGGDRTRAAGGIRSTIASLAIRRLRWGYLTHGDDDPRRSSNLALLDAALEGGGALFPV
jgi:aminoglycoside phosphotransferase (APT) family kinase protein